MRLVLALLLALFAVDCAHSQGGMGPGPGTVHSTGGGGGITFTGTDAVTWNPSFGALSQSINIGTASSDRIVVVGFVSNSTSQGTLTLNGTNMTNAAGNCATAANVCVQYLNVTSGTTATLGSSGGGSNAAAVVVGIFTGQSGGGSATPNTGVTYTGGGAESSITVTPTFIASGMCPVATGFSFQPSGTPVYTWSGTSASGGDRTTGATAVGSVIGLAHSIASGAIGISTTGVNVTTGLGFGGTMAAACWAP